MQLQFHDSAVRAGSRCAVKRVFGDSAGAESGPPYTTHKLLQTVFNLHANHVKVIVCSIICRTCSL